MNATFVLDLAVLVCFRLPPALMLGLLLSKSGHGIFNVHNDGSSVCVCCAHEGETDTDESATSGDSEELKKSLSLFDVQIIMSYVKFTQNWLSYIQPYLTEFLYLHALFSFFLARVPRFK